ncbi:MAG TPA: isocitrate/isopropylmalate family dehydrogenase, partial [Deferrisomatales bacterium]|nr:isocitrate/isopropylmalate family dehydrogenase [Deferrisomatales bacterium]
MTTATDHPRVVYLEGDGIGPEVTPAAIEAIDAAVAGAYGGARGIEWQPAAAGKKAFQELGTPLPNATLDAIRATKVALKGPLETPVGGGIRSLNVALRQTLDLYACVRPVRYYNGVPSPVLHPEYVDMVIFRENTEDIYAGIEFENGTQESKEFKALLKEHFPQEYAKIRFPDSSGIGLKPVS